MVESPRMLLRSSLGALLVLSGLLPAGCAHYYLPTSQLDTPETIGPERIGRLELLGIQSGTDLVSTPSPGSTDPVSGAVSDPSLQMAPANYVFGAWIGVSPGLDVGVRLEPYAPLLARLKYQLTGDPESIAKRGNFSVSLSGSGGLLLGKEGSNSVTFYSALGSLIGGYRFATHHLASLAPFFNLAGLSGSTALPSSGTRYGASLGYQYDIESLIFRLELTWASGSFSRSAGSASAGGYFPGMLLGFKL